MKYKVRCTDNEFITYHYHSSKGYIFVFIDDGCDNICSTRTSILVESDTEAYTAHGCTNNTGHKILSCTEQ